MVDGEKKSPLPELERFKSECLTIICQFIKSRGHKVPEVRIALAGYTTCPLIVLHQSFVLKTSLVLVRILIGACMTGARQKAHGQAGT